MKISPELLERIQQDAKRKNDQKKEGFIREKSAWDVKKKRLRNILRIKSFVHELLRVGLSEELITHYVDRPSRPLVHNIVKGWKRVELPKILQQRAKKA